MRSTYAMTVRPSDGRINKLIAIWGFGEAQVKPTPISSTISIPVEFSGTTMEKKSENLAHPRDGIKLRSLKNSGRLRNSTTQDVREAANKVLNTATALGGSFG